MITHEFWIFVHIILFVFWLGADLGVFLLTKKATDPSLDIGQRDICMEMANIIDLTPRLAFTLMFPVGLMLVPTYGITVPPVILATVWGIALIWFAMTVWLMKAKDPKVQAMLGTGFRWWQWVLTVGLGGLGLYALITDQIFPPDWLALKVLLFGVIALLANSLMWFYGPAVPAYQAIRTEGSTPERESQFKGAVDRTLIAVGTLYFTLAVMAFLGTVGVPLLP